LAARSLKAVFSLKTLSGEQNHGTSRLLEPILQSARGSFFQTVRKGTIRPLRSGDHLVGAHVRLLRMEAGLSQQALADQSGFFRTYISRIEGGTANPTIAVIAALAKVLKVQTAELFRE
jgi:DNA-binding XRE family transcriptional regulator